MIAIERPSTDVNGEPSYHCNLNSASYHHRMATVQLESGPSLKHLTYSMPNKKRNGLVKYCGVCGDIAKSKSKVIILVVCRATPAKHSSVDPPRMTITFNFSALMKVNVSYTCLIVNVVSIAG